MSSIWISTVSNTSQREKDSSHRPHGYLHPGFALKNARELTTLSKMEEDIIIKHMWPLTIRPPRYRESFIVSMADKYCATWELILSLIPKQAKKHKEILRRHLEA